MTGAGRGCGVRARVRARGRGKADAGERDALRVARALRPDTVKGLVLLAVGLVLLGLAAVVPQPTGGGLEAVVAGFAVLGGFTALLLGGILYLMATRV